MLYIYDLCLHCMKWFSWVEPWWRWHQSLRYHKSLWLLRETINAQTSLDPLYCSDLVRSANYWHRHYLQWKMIRDQPGACGYVSPRVLITPRISAANELENTESFISASTHSDHPQLTRVQNSSVGISAHLESVICQKLVKGQMYVHIRRWTRTI